MTSQIFRLVRAAFRVVIVFSIGALPPFTGSFPGRARFRVDSAAQRQHYFHNRWRAAVLPLPFRGN